MRFIKSIFFTTYSFLLTCTSINVYAAGDDYSLPPPIIKNPLSVDTIQAFIQLILDTIFPIAAMLSIFFLIYAGFSMVMAGGSEEKLSKAKSMLIWTMVGIAILLGAKVLSAVICGTISQLGAPGLTCPSV